MKRIIAVSFLVFLLSSLTLRAQQVRHFSGNDGMVSGTVNSFQKDSLGYIWIGTDRGISRYSGFNFKNYELNPGTKSSESRVYDIINHNGDLYVLNPSGIIYKYKYEQDRFSIEYINEEYQFLSFEAIDDERLLIGLQSGFLTLDLTNKGVSEVQNPDILLNRKLVVYNDKIFSATSRGVHVLSYNREQNKLYGQEKFLTNQDIIDLAIDENQKIWAGTETGGLFVIDSGKVEQVNIPQLSKKTYAIRQITFDNKGKALIAIDRLGLFVINQELEIENIYSHSVDDDNTITQNSIYEIFVDESNAYWLGFNEAGINVIRENGNLFNNISHIKNQPNSIHNNNIRSIYEAKNGCLWFGTEDGISKFSDGIWSNFNQDEKLFNTAVLAIGEYDGGLVLGTYGEGLLRLNENTGVVSKTSVKELNPLRFIFNIEVFDNDLWLGAIDGPLTNYSDNEFVRSYGVGLVRSFVEGYDEVNYAGTIEGFYEINNRNGAFRKIEETLFNETNEIHDLNFDQKNNCIWIACEEGLYKYYLSSDKVEKVSKEFSQNLGIVFSVERDNMHNLYLASSTGLWKYDIKNEIFRKFKEDDGLHIDEFGFGASHKLKDGSIAFGGPKGAVIFNPLDIEPDNHISDIYLSDFLVNGKELDSVSLSKNINFVDDLVLNYDQNTLSFKLETIKFHGSKQGFFKWKLEGYDQDYRTDFANQEVSYPNLDPGDYSLHVKGFNADGVVGENELRLNIYIKNPFWKTWGAYLVYILIVVSFVFLVFKVAKANARKKFDENKIKFFIDVAHDIRTPVSLIQLLVKQLSTQENTEKSIELIQRNSQNLNEYVTQLLDFQKIDRKQLKLNVSKVDLKDCIASVTDDFTPILQEKHLDLVLEVKHIPVWFDVKKMKRIFYNIISNAIKYSNEGGEIKIKAFLSDDNLRIEFIDNGIGIPEKQQDLIFKRFSRGTNVSNKGIPGTGIGLMLSKKIVELHGGEILLESKENVGSKFTIVLPNGTEHYESEVLQNSIEGSDERKEVDTLIHKDKLILLVEDNDELRNAIANELRNHFTVLEAENGKEGLLLAISKNPDLIITDVMMPIMDGKELCKLIKTNFKTSHIPVVMLTAMVGVDDKIKGLETGADAYVEKPFNVEILNVTIKNLLKSRENISRLFENNVESKKQLSPDESFLSDVINIIKENLKEEDFSIDVLCGKMGLSRSNLFRKLKGLIQMSPSDLIIKIKLSHAEELMKSKSLNRISDIAYDSGFHDPKYFSTLFKKHYGKSPREFMESN